MGKHYSGQNLSFLITPTFPSVLLAGDSKVDELMLRAGGAFGEGASGLGKTR